ncbi:MAG: TonB family protein [Thiohalomonadaceae bacterium]
MQSAFRQWGFALVLSALVHGALLYQASVDAGRPDGKQTREAVRLSFRSVASPAVPAAKAVETPVPVPEKPKPPKPKPKPKPKRKVVERVEPVQPPQEQPPRETVPEPTAVSAPVTTEDTTAAEAAIAQAASLAQARQQYEQLLMAHIESHKFYPPIARRRGVQGRVHVSFMVVEAGGVAGLRCTSGPGLLESAACNAVSSALPLPAPPTGLSLPLPVSFGMEFSLRAAR